jgi:2,3-bisphosphoglycerate-independent phosphoglycerate mutase
MNPVPCLLVSDLLKDKVSLKKGKLADVAPTLLALLGLQTPREMTGDLLIHPH